MKSPGMLTVKMGGYEVRDACEITAVGRWGLRTLLHRLRLRVLSESARVNSRIRAPIKIIQSQHAPTSPPLPPQSQHAAGTGGGGQLQVLGVFHSHCGGPTPCLLTRCRKSLEFAIMAVHSSHAP